MPCDLIKCFALLTSFSLSDMRALRCKRSRFRQLKFHAHHFNNSPSMEVGCGINLLTDQTTTAAVKYIFREKTVCTARKSLTHFAKFTGALGDRPFSGGRSIHIRAAKLRKRVGCCCRLHQRTTKDLVRFVQRELDHLGFSSCCSYTSF